MITEVFEQGGSAPGQFTIPLDPDIAPRALQADLTELGQIIITADHIDPLLVGDAGITSKAIFAGPVLEVYRDGRQFDVLGAGPAWWLGDEAGEGDLTEGVTIAAQNLAASLAAVAPATLDAGTITEPGGTFTGDFDAVTPLEAFRSICESFGAEFRVNYDGTYDAAVEATLYPSSTTPTAIVTRRQGAGSDPNLTGLEVERMASHRDARNYLTRAIAVKDTGDAITIPNSVNRTGGTTYYGPNGSAMVRTKAIPLPSGGTASDVDTYLQAEIDASDVADEMIINTTEFEIDGDVTIGDTVWAWNPPLFIDTAETEQSYRGELIRPTKKRLLTFDWPTTIGQGIYFRPPLATVAATDYIDLTRWILWERQ